MSSVPRILIVDDDPRMCDGLQILLTGEGYETKTRHSGRDALEALNKDRFDLVLLDFVLPDIDGAEALARMSRKTPETNVVVMTGYPSLDAAIDCLKKGAFDYLRKPFEYEELSEVVKKALHHNTLKGEKEQSRQVFPGGEETYRNLFKTAMVGLYRTRIEDGKVLVANQAFADIFGYDSPEQAEAECFTSARYADPTRRKELLKQLAERGRVDEFEIAATRRDGSPIHIAVSAVVCGDRGYIEGFLIDITDRRQVQAALRESEEKYKTAVESSLTGIFIHQDGRYVFVNDRFAQIHGYTPEELLGKEHLTLIHPDERSVLAERAAARLGGEPVPQHYEVRRLRKDGTTAWCDMVATRIEYEGRPAIMGNIIDITERKRSQEALRQSEKRTGMLRFANDVALKLMDELRNPLTAIGGFSALISSREYPKDKLKEYARIISEESSRLNHAVNEVLAHLQRAAEDL